MKVTYKGVTKNQSEWAEFFGVTRGAITTRMSEYGETADQAVAYFATRVGEFRKTRDEKQREADMKMSSRGVLIAILQELRKMNGGAKCAIRTKCSSARLSCRHSSDVRRTRKRKRSAANLKPET